MGSSLKPHFLGESSSVLESQGDFIIHFLSYTFKAGIYSWSLVVCFFTWKLFILINQAVIVFEYIHPPPTKTDLKLENKLNLYMQGPDSISGHHL